MTRLFLIVGAFLIAAGTAWIDAAAVAGQTIEERVRDVARQLMCPVCEGQTVAESSSELADQMRAVIREQLELGRSPQQILDYFAGRYGESILAAPTRRGLNLLVWIGPPAVLLGGVGLAMRTLRRWTRPPPSAHPD